MSVAQREPVGTTAPALSVRDLQFTYPQRRRQPATPALRGINLEIPAGQAVALLGPNGSGKSTLFKLICGMLPMQHGSIGVFGHDEPAMMRRSMGVVFQSEGLDRHMTVFENLRDQALLYGMSASQAADVIEMELIRSGLVDRGHAMVKSLSKGLARRVDLIRAMMHRPGLLLLDEPTVGLDPAARQQFLDHLHDIRQQSGLTIIFSTHLVDEADLQDRVLLMHQGLLIADDTPANLRRRAGNRRIVVHDAAWQPAPGEQNLWARTSIGWKRAIDDARDDPRQIAADLASAGGSFSISTPTLADVFEQLTGSRLDDAPARDANAREVHA